MLGLTVCNIVNLSQKYVFLNFLTSENSGEHWIINYQQDEILEPWAMLADLLVINYSTSYRFFWNCLLLLVIFSDYFIFMLSIFACKFRSNKPLITGVKSHDKRNISVCKTENIRSWNGRWQFKKLKISVF